MRAPYAPLDLRLLLTWEPSLSPLCNIMYYTALNVTEKKRTDFKFKFGPIGIDENQLF